MRIEKESYDRSGVHLLIFLFFGLALACSAVPAENWFGDPIKTVLPEEPENLAFGYFNQDTLLDVAYVTETSHLHVLFNAGNGHFNYSDMYVAGKSDLATGDLDHYGGDDVITVNRYPNEVLMFLDDGDGLFELPIAISSPAYLRLVRIGDLDSDGDSDVVAFGEVPPLCTESILIFWGNGFGVEETPDIYECQIDPECPELCDTAANELKIADFTGDGLTDILIAAFGTGYNCLEERGVALLRNQGDRQFSESVEWILRENDSYFPDFDLGYLNGDTLLDVCASRSPIRTFINTGDGQLEAGPWIEDIPGSYIAVDDLNGDGLVDLATSSHRYDWASLSRGFGNGEFEVVQILLTYLSDLEIAQIDDHPGPDLIGYKGDTLNVLPNITYLDPSSIDETHLTPGTQLMVAPSIITSTGCRIEFQSDPETASSLSIKVEIVDLLGRRCKTLSITPDAQGVVSTRWDGTDDTGNPVSAGVYWVNAVGGGRQVSTKVAVIR